MLTPADLPPGYVLVIARADRVRVEDVSDDQLFIDGDIDTAGVLIFEIRAEREDGSRASVHGKALFELMMRHFGAWVRAIHSIWTDGPNLAEFNRLTALGWTPERAAGGTWTGQRAKDHGFPVAVRVRTTGSPGWYGWVEFLFTR